MSQSAQAVFIVHKNVGYLFQKVLMGRRSRCGARSLTQCHLRVLRNGGGVCDAGEGNQGMGSNLRSMSFLFPVFFSFLLILLGRSFLYPEKYVAG